MDESKKQELYQLGVLVFVILGILTFGEFAFSTIAVGWWQPLVIIAVIKAWFIVRDYMHISRVFTQDKEGHGS